MEGWRLFSKNWAMVHWFWKDLSAGWKSRGMPEGLLDMPVEVELERLVDGGSHVSKWGSRSMECFTGDGVDSGMLRCWD